MGNYLKMADRQRILALLELGWSYRQVAREAGVSRQTVAKYDPRRSAKPANPSTGSGSKPSRVSPGPQSAVEPYRTLIEAGAARGLTAQPVRQDLKADCGFGYAYASIKRFVRRARSSHPEVAVTGHPKGATCGRVKMGQW